MSKVFFPRPFAFAVDDLGWNEGSDMSENVPPGPYRAGVKRNFDLNDYRHMVEAGRLAGTRIQCLFILSEMDRENILARYPTTTWQREKWNNSFRVNESQKVIMNYVHDHAAFMEFGLHGTGHEYWAPGEPQKRAEWYNLFDKRPWPEQSIREHIQCFRDIMAQYGLTKDNGHSFPESFVPCAYSYYWNPGGEYSLGKLLTEAGVKYANTDFSQIPELKPPGEINGGGFDFGTHVINRINYGNIWYELATLPRVPLEQQQTDIIESHWPNWLAQDDVLQPAVTASWVAYYKSAQRMEDRYIAKNTEQLHSQWLYRKYAIVTQQSPGKVLIDNRKMPDEPYRFESLGSMVLKLRLPEGNHISSAQINGKKVPAFFEDEGFGFFYLPRLEREVYTLSYSIGTELPRTGVFLEGTYNVYSMEERAEGVVAGIRMYGTQSVTFFADAPVDVRVAEGDLMIRDVTFDASAGLLRVVVTARDMQGSTGKIVIAPR